MNNKYSDVFINRELSWLEFNRRVLELSRAKQVPIGERLKFAAIFASNLDEFFMVRVGSLYDQMLLKNTPRENKTNMSPEEQIGAILPVVASLLRYKEKALTRLFHSLEKIGVYHIDFKNLTKKEEKFWKNYFTDELLPLLSPQVIDKRHPFPFLRNLECYVAASIKSKGAGGIGLALIPISTQLPRVITLNSDGNIIFTFCEELLLHFAQQAIGEISIKDKCIFRVTRNADLTMSEAMMEHDIDYREVMSELLKKRRKLAPVRLEVSQNAPRDIVDILLEKLPLSHARCLETPIPLDMAACLDISKLLFEHPQSSSLFYKHFTATVPQKGYTIADATKNKDLLLCYPYQSMRPFLKMLYTLAVDPEVLSIKMTLYRMARDSKVIDALIAAADHGKEVVTIVELRARFDEQNNINWSNRLENAGCTVIYGYEDYKIHSKLCLITKLHKGQKRYISFIGTGNFNESTAELYTDLSYISQDDELGNEVASLFHDLSLGRHTTSCNRLLVAPLCFKNELVRQIDTEIENKKNGLSAGILLKCNSISDKSIIEKLIEASIAGVEIDLIVRGICCIRAGVIGKTENIRVRSLVGRFLEHSRIYRFGEGYHSRIYISSADFLTRNTERRVEVGVKITDENSRKKIEEIIKIELSDNCNARIMKNDGHYEKVKPQQGGRLVNSHKELFALFQDFNEIQNNQLQNRISLLDHIKAFFRSSINFHQ